MSTAPQTCPRTTTPAADAKSSVLVTRQPIYDSSMTVKAYELLYHSPRREGDAEGGSGLAALRALADAALDIGLDRLAGGLPVHIKYPPELLFESPPSLQPSRVVIEVRGERTPGTGLIEAVRELRTRGHHVALDCPGVEPDPELLDVVDIVKLDAAGNDSRALETLAPELIACGVRLFAQKVTTIEQFERCAALGFEAFQGEFLHRPESFRAQRLPANRLATLRLVAALQSEDYSLDALEQLVGQDLSIAYRVLRCINSSFYSLPRRVESIRHAIVILGLDALRQLCTLVALQGLDHRPSSLFLTAMTRARMCEQLARTAGARETGSYFITGLFSLLDVLTGIPIAKLLDELPLSETVERALLAHEGDLGAALKCARAYERAAWGRARYGGLAPQLLRAAYVDAVFWAEQAQAIISN
jgi:c-di-GMP phosphodiesterase